MLSPKQIKLIHIAKGEAGLDEADYRERLALLLDGCATSKDARLREEHFDRLMAWMEFDFWARVDGGMPMPERRRAFLQREYWHRKNQAGNTSRDRHNGDQLEQRILTAEAGLTALGVSRAYLDGILRRTGPGWTYLSALQRTLVAKGKGL